MVRVFYSQKTEQVVSKFHLEHWRKMTQENINQNHQDLSDNWKMRAIGERIRLEGRDLASIKDLSPETIKLGYDFSVSIQERDSQKALEIITQIEQLPTIWRSEQ